VRVAAYQAPLLDPSVSDALDLIRTQIERCEAEEVRILCCPEAILGGLADYGDDPFRFAIPLDRLDDVLSPLSSDVVTTIVGFTELASGGRLFNAAAVFHRGSVAGVYRKLYPAINRSVYDAGTEVPVFRVEGLTFGVAICNDSNYYEPARLMAAEGATALFVPSNNALPPVKGGPELVTLARTTDIARAVENSLWIVRADVAGQNGGLVSHGSTGVVDPNGTIVSAASTGGVLVVAEIDLEPRRRRRGWDAARNPAVMERYLQYVEGLTPLDV